jgi:hypothetical protein
MKRLRRYTSYVGRIPAVGQRASGRAAAARIRAKYALAAQNLAVELVSFGWEFWAIQEFLDVEAGTLNRYFRRAGHPMRMPYK